MGTDDVSRIATNTGEVMQNAEKAVGSLVEQADRQEALINESKQAHEGRRNDA
jgi:hypothetical protein